MVDKNIQVIQWNIRSIITNRDTLINIIKDLNPDIISVNETWLKKDNNFYLRNYNILRDDRRDGYGGVAFIIRNNIVFKQIHLPIRNVPRNFQFLIIEIGTLSIINVYNPPNQTLNLGVLETILSSMSTNNILLLGDFNGHHPLWGSDVTNNNGVIFSEFVSNTDLICLNNGDSTRLVGPSQTKSALDVSFISSAFNGQTDWCVLHDYVGMSDHFPILLSLNQTSALNVQNYNYFEGRYNTGKADWNRFETYLINNPINESSSYVQIAGNIVGAADVSIPKFKGFSNSGNPWWDSDCDDAIKEKRISLKSFFFVIQIWKILLILEKQEQSVASFLEINVKVVLIGFVKILTLIRMYQRFGLRSNVFPGRLRIGVLLGQLLVMWFNKCYTNFHPPFFL